MSIQPVCPIDLIPEDGRLTTFPIARPDIFAWYTDSADCYWTVNELTLSEDPEHYKTRLSAGEQHFVKYVLAFFSASDGIICLNVSERFKKDIPILEVQYFYDYQIMMENVHAHTYSILLDAIIPSQTERETLLNAITTMPIITKMSKYMFRCIDSEAPFAERLLSMACVEGIFFTGCFCAIYWLQNRGLMPALGHSNELIARDEALHTMFAMYLYTLVKPELKLSRVEIVRVVSTAVDLAKEFIHEALPESLPEMSAELMIPYIECQADNLVSLIDSPPIYNASHNFTFMDQQNMCNRTNFFERRVSEYSKVSTADVGNFDTATDF